MTCECSGENSIFRKRDKTILFTVSGLGDLTGGAAWFSVKSDVDDTDANAIISKKTLTVGGADTEMLITEGYIKETDKESKYYRKMVSRIEVYIIPDDTESVTPGDYTCDMVIRTPGGKTYQGVDPTPFTVKQPATMT